MRPALQGPLDSGTRHPCGEPSLGRRQSQVQGELAQAPAGLGSGPGPQELREGTSCVQAGMLLFPQDSAEVQGARDSEAPSLCFGFPCNPTSGNRTEEYDPPFWGGKGPAFLRTALLPLRMPRPANPRQGMLTEV